MNSYLINLMVCIATSFDPIKGSLFFKGPFLFYAILHQPPPQLTE